MSLFNSKKAKKSDSQSALAGAALNAIHDGVIMIDQAGRVVFINPAAVSMTECGSASTANGLDYGLIIKFETKEGRELSEAENPLVQAFKNHQPLESYQASLIAAKSGKRIPVAISLIQGEKADNSIITLRDIAKELEEEGEQAEFISTASHEMRTPVATIDGYLSLCLNPQTATIDERAKGYLTAAQAASKHLGKLFQDLLDATKLDDGKIRPRFVPAEMVGLVRSMAEDYAVQAKEAKLDFKFGSDDPSSFGDNHKLKQVVYGFVDVDFMREILDNLIENAIKYTPAGGSIYVNVRGDGDRVLINVTDTGIGISADDIGHIFQKFYRADNSDTRTIGGTGLGLYLVKQRTEAMGGKVWAESAFGEGSTFYVSLPRLSNDEYEKRMIMYHNQEIQNQMMQQAATEARATVPMAAPQPAAPVQPVVPARPTQLAAPIRPVQPAASAQPTVSTQPVVSARPVTPTQPVVPARPTVPVQPIQPSPRSPAPPNPTQPVQQNINNLNGEPK